MLNSQFQIMAVGEILWDLFPDHRSFGGAPANYACGTSQLGGDLAQVRMFSAVGNDELGNLALEQLARHGVDDSLVQRTVQPTGSVQIELNDDGSARYEFAADVAWDNLRWNDDLLEPARQCDAVCFGSLAQRSPVSARTIQRLVAETRPDCLRIFDINLRFPHVVHEVIQQSLELCNVVKLNDDELEYLADWLGMSGSQDELVGQIREKFDLSLVALTLGSQGAVIYQGDQKAQGMNRPETVVDTVGAGDAFTAAFTLKWLQMTQQTKARDSRQPNVSQLEELVDYATRVAAFVCTQPGATPTFPASFQLDT